MPYDVRLEERIDGLTGDLGPMAKKKMFGGVGYMAGGSICFGIHKDSLIVRTSVQQADGLLKDRRIAPFNITGRPMRGWVSVSADAVKTDEQLLSMLRLGFDFARSLEQKAG